MHKIIMITAAVIISLIYVSNVTVYAASDYQKGYKVGRHDGLKEGVFHHDKQQTENGQRTAWYQGYVDGWSKGCLESGRDSENCDVQMDANTP